MRGRGKSKGSRSEAGPAWGVGRGELGRGREEGAERLMEHLVACAKEFRLHFH